MLSELSIHEPRTFQVSSHVSINQTGINQSKALQGRNVDFKSNLIGDVGKRDLVP